MYPEDGNRFFPGTDASATAGHLGGDTWVADAAIAMMENEAWSGMFVTLGAIDKAGHMWGAQNDSAGGSCATGAEQTHVKCAAANADVQFGKLLDTVEDVDADRGRRDPRRPDGRSRRDLRRDVQRQDDIRRGRHELVLRAERRLGRRVRAVDKCIDTTTYNNPSPALQPLRDTNNLAFVYGSTAVEAWLVDRTPAKMQEAADAGLKLAGSIASYYRSGDGFALAGTNKMSQSEKDWWKDHGQGIVDSMAAPNGPDIVVLLHDKTSYGVYGDHGGAQESVQRVPMVFWAPSLAYGVSTGRPFQTTDVMPTILATMGIELTAPVDGTARRLGH